MCQSEIWLSSLLIDGVVGNKKHRRRPVSVRTEPLVRWQFAEEGMLKCLAQRYTLRRLVLQHARYQVEQLPLLFAVTLHVPLKKKHDINLYQLFRNNTEDIRTSTAVCISQDSAHINTMVDEGLVGGLPHEVRLRPTLS